MLFRQGGSISKAVFQLRPVQKHTIKKLQQYTHLTYTYNIKHTY